MLLISFVSAFQRDVLKCDDEWLDPHLEDWVYNIVINVAVRSKLWNFDFFSLCWLPFPVGFFFKLDLFELAVDSGHPLNA